MANPFTQTPQLASGFLNAENNPILGKSVSPDSLPSTAYGGMLGKIFECDDAEALKLSSLVIGTLYGGVYQCVQTLSTSTQANAIGQLVFWSNQTTMIVTPDPPTPLMTFAGVLLNTVIKGNYCWICVAGSVNTLYGTITKGGGAVAGDLVIATSATTGKADVLADATAVTWASAATRIGRAFEAATTGQTKRVTLDWNNRNY